MRYLHISLISLLAVVFVVGCAEDPKEDETDATTAASGGSGGEGGSGGGEAGAAGQAGAAGAEPAPFKFDCTDVDDSHFVVKAKLPEPIPPGYFAIDGSKIYPEGSGFQNVLWGSLFIADQIGLANVAWDDGKVPTSTRYELNFGMSADGKILFETGHPGEKVAIDPNKGPWFYFPNLICCFGGKEIGGYQSGGTTGKLAIDGDGENVVIITE